MPVALGQPSPPLGTATSSTAVSTDVVQYVARMPPPWLATSTSGTLRPGRSAQLRFTQRLNASCSVTELAVALLRRTAW
jgi:hypothetical protein